MKAPFSKTRLLWITAIIVTLLVAAGLRLWNLPRPPAGPYYDEAANGILAASIANENYRPIFITSYTGKEVLFFYLAALVIKLLGPDLYALRLTSALAGIAAVAAAYWCVSELYTQPVEEETSHPPGRNPLTAARASLRSSHRQAAVLALLAAALLATSFWHLALSRIGLRAVTQPLLQALTLAALWRGLRTGNKWTLGIAGIFCGLTGYTYLAARLFPFPLALALLALLLADRANWRRRLVQAAVFIAAAAVIIAPLAIYFQQNPDRFTTRIEQVSAEGETLTLAQAMGQALGMFFIRGDPLARLNIPGMPVFSPLLAAFFLLGLLLTVVRLFSPSRPVDRARSVLLLSWIPLMILPTALTVADVIPHNLRAAGLLPLVYLFPALGLVWSLDFIGQLVSRGQKTVPPAGYLLLWLAVLALAAPLTFHNYFNRLAVRSDHYEISDGDLANAAGWLNDADLSNSTVYIASVHYRHPTLAFLAKDYASFKWLSGGRTLVVPPEGSALVVVPRSVNMKWSSPYLAAAVSLPTPNGPDGKTAFLAYQLDPDSLPAPANQTNVDFSHIIRLDGYDVLGQSGGTLDVVLHWTVLNPPPRDDFQPFIHLVDAWGLEWSQVMPFQYPSAQWEPGERFVDRMRVPIPAGTPPGSYVLQAGWYSAAAGANLNIVQDDGAFGGVVAQLPVTLSRSEPSADQGLDDIRQRPDDIRQGLDLEMLPGLHLLGVNLDTTSARTRQSIYLSLFWQTGTPMEDFEVVLRLGSQTLYRGAPVHGTYPASHWEPPENVVDKYSPRVPLDAPAGKQLLTLEIIGTAGRSAVVELGTVEIATPPRVYDRPTMHHTLDVPFGNEVELLGYDLDGLDETEAALTLYWRCQQEMEQDYTVFVHLLDAGGALVGQADTQPQQGEYPTSLWAPGEIIADRYRIPVPPDPAKPPSLKVGMYLPLTGDRLGEAVLK